MLFAAVDTNAAIAKVWQTLDANRDLIAKKVVDYTPKAATAAVILVIGLFIARWLGQATMRQLMKREMEPPVRMILVRLVKLLVLALTALVIADNLEIKLIPLLAGLGVVGVGVGLAMQGVLSNLVAGLTIIFVKSFRVGEYIEIAGVHGQVDQIELFSTILIHPDLSRVVVPNRKIVGEIIHNYGRLRQANLSVGVAYDTDLNRALEIISRVLAANPRVLKSPAPVIGTETLGDSAVVLAIKPWAALADFGPMQIEVNKAVLEALQAAKISIPFPQREIRVLPGGDFKSVA
jgi:small conductance mechanosensitive channel